MREEIRQIQALMEGAAYITDPAISTARAPGDDDPEAAPGRGARRGRQDRDRQGAGARPRDNLIRLQCYEGLDAVDGALRVELPEADPPDPARGAGRPVGVGEGGRHLLGGLPPEAPAPPGHHPDGRAPVLLIDEIDRADLEFESFLLEVLSDFQVTVPEIGTIGAAHRPDVVLTSNRSRDLSDALRRRCLYLWIDYPSFEKEVRILRTKVPGIDERLAGQIARVMQNLRRRQLQKVPGVAESLDWGAALVALHADHLDAELVRETLGCVLKEVDDVKRIEADLAAGRLSELLEG